MSIHILLLEKNGSGRCLTLLQYEFGTDKLSDKLR